MLLTCFNEEDLIPAAGKLLDSHSESKVFAFYGLMGVGKTTFIKAICKVLKVCDTVQSPTFSIVNEYKTVDGNSVYHIDFYRIKKMEEVFDIGYEDYLYSDSFCLIEWPEMIENLLPSTTIKVHISENISDGARNIEF
ncbi:MAG: tRNA (adenosine(37)-N6)-threonylcarbamoyltransferase complex ATPase subunit type 1 TsaE [Bacteroidales bacterium]|nr:tRNA (adenosine(37)-N6)-threonylcarbamoyltransferase complex ATPase subunit type 1 TsaE [Bacteroidales bacterium]